MKMKKLKHYFGELEMTTERVLLFALITAVYTAAVALIPALRDTSLGDIAVYYDPWILFAVWIAVNCRSRWEAGFKCFLFFLVSQPLIYLFQVPFSSQGFGLFRYYPHWFFITLLTLPGGAIAYEVKRKDWLSVLVLSVATCFLSLSSVYYASMAYADPPRHLLSALFAAALGVFLILVLLDGRKYRIAALSLMLAAWLACAVFIGAGMLQKRTMELALEPGEWVCEVEDEAVVSVGIEEGNRVTVTAGKAGGTYLYFRNADGTERTFYATVSGGGVYLNEFEDEEE